MRLHSLLALSGATLLAGACASSTSRSPDTAPSTAGNPTASAPAASAPAPGAPAASGPMWQGEIRPESGTSVGGTVMVMPGAASGQTTATVTLSGAPANGTHPWHLHSGTCAAKGPIVGPPAAYTPLTVDANGAARLEATLPFATPTTGSYSVNVHMSPTQMGMVVGCADLKTS